MAPRRGSTGSFQMRTTDPYQATRPFNVEAEPFDFASQGREFDDLLRAGAERKAQRWEAPEFNFKQSPEFKMDVDPVTQQVREFKQGAAEDDPIFGLLGSGLESRGEDPVDWGVNTVKNWTKGKSPSRVMGSIASSLPVEEVKAGLLAGKAALGAKGLTSIAGILPTGGYRRDILKLGDLVNHRLNIDTPELEKTMRLAEAAAPEKLVTGFYDTLANHPAGHSKIQKIVDLADTNAPEADITDEMARQMGLFANQGQHHGAMAPPRQGSFPGLASIEAPVSSGSGHRTVEDVAGGPVVDYGRAGLGGIIDKAHKRSATGGVLEKGTPRSFDRSGNRGRAVSPSDAEQESAQTRVMELLRGDTPVAHLTEGGGTTQRFLPESFERWPYTTPSHLKTPEIANQIAAEQARDVFGNITDRHIGQFMVDPAAKKVVGVDKGFGSMDRYGFRGLLMPPEHMIGSGIDMYEQIAKQGDMAGLVDPDTYQRMARLGLSIPEADWKRTLEPLMEGNRIYNQADKDTALRNFMQSIQGMPQHLERYYNRFVKP